MSGMSVEMEMKRKFSLLVSLLFSSIMARSPAERQRPVNTTFLRDSDFLVDIELKIRIALY
jgi:hypothetical protein